MLGGGPSARAFGLRGGIPMEAAQTSVSTFITQGTAARPPAYALKQICICHYARCLPDCPPS